jgi:PhnB protein
MASAASATNGHGKEQAMQIDAYLLFNGNCEEAFRFYERLLGGRIEMMSRHEGTPAAEHVPKEWLGKILHTRMAVGNGHLMASDAPPGHYEKPQGFSMSLNVDSTREAERIFTGLAEGGTVRMPLAPTFWAARFGMAVDRFGTPWMVNCERDA